MEKFTTLSGIAAPLMRANIDTDAIIPMKWLVTATRTGLGRGLFGAWRYLPDGSENPQFVLNQPPYRKACMIIAGANFGCGSSREHAPWALTDFGIRCIIAPSFASIFHENCVKNGILPVVLAQEQVDALAVSAQGGDAGIFQVDLRECVVIDPCGARYAFDIAPAHRKALLEGQDEIDLTLSHAAAIDQFQQADRSRRPWIYPQPRAAQ